MAKSYKDVIDSQTFYKDERNNSIYRLKYPG